MANKPSVKNRIMKSSINGEMLHLLLFLALCAPHSLFGQFRPAIDIQITPGVSDVRNFGYAMDIETHNFRMRTYDVSYVNHNQSTYMISAGFALSNQLSRHNYLGWRAGLHIRNGGFNVSSELLNLTGDYRPDDLLTLPPFNTSKRIDYWSLHAPISFTYQPFDRLGFSLGPDFYYQLSENPSSPRTYKNSRNGLLGKHLGTSWSYYPQYTYPFQVGAHIGAFTPIGNRFMVEVQAFTDITPRLTIHKLNGISYRFREMGAHITVSYRLNPRY